MKHCSACGMNFDDSWNVCVKCGGALESVPGSAPSVHSSASSAAPSYAPLLTERERLSRINADYLRRASGRLKRDFVWYVVLSLSVWIFLFAAALLSKTQPSWSMIAGSLTVASFVVSTVLGFVVPFRLAFVRNALGDSAALHLLLAIFVPFGIVIIPIFAIVSAQERLRQIESEKVEATAAVPRLGGGAKAILAFSLFLAAFSTMMIFAAVALPVAAGLSRAVEEQGSPAAGGGSQGEGSGEDSDADRSLESYYRELGIEQ